MTGSPAFARIQAQVLQTVASIPPGRLCTYQAIGEHLDVMPRHVAYILSQLDDSSKMVYPWHRVVAADGRLGTPKQGPDGRSQASLLQEEGIGVAAGRVSAPLERHALSPAALDHGLPRQLRPPPGEGGASGTKGTSSTRHRSPARRRP